MLSRFNRHCWLRVAPQAGSAQLSCNAPCEQNGRRWWG